MFEDFREGDEISWWDDGHGRGADPADPGAQHRTGVIRRVCWHPGGEAQVVALLVERQGPLGPYDSTVRPDRGHRPQVIIPAAQRAGGEDIDRTTP